MASAQAALDNPPHCRGEGTVGRRPFKPQKASKTRKQKYRTLDDIQRTEAFLAWRDASAGEREIKWTITDGLRAMRERRRRSILRGFFGTDGEPQESPPLEFFRSQKEVSEVTDSQMPISAAEVPDATNYQNPEVFKATDNQMPASSAYQKPASFAKVETSSGDLDSSDSDSEDEGSLDSDNEDEGSSDSDNEDEEDKSKYAEDLLLVRLMQCAHGKAIVKEFEEDDLEEV